MVSLLRVIPVGILLLVTGCFARQVQAISGAQFVDYGDTLLSHTIYLGSDNGYHYFVWEDGTASGQWKVPREELRVTNPFALGDREAFLLKRPDGQWCAYPCN